MIIHSPIISGSLTFADGATVTYPSGGNYNGSFTGVVNSTNGVISGSSQVDANSITNFDSNVLEYVNDLGMFSGSSQVDGTGISNNTITIAGNSTALGGEVTLANITAGSGIVSSSTQIDNLFDIDGLVSSSTQVISLLPAGTVSGSSQVDADSVSNFDSNVLAYINSISVVSGSITHYTDSDTLSYINDLGVISGSSQVDGTGISNNTITIAGNSVSLNGSVTLSEITNGSGIVSGSSQLYTDLDARYGNELGDNLVSSSTQISDYGVFAELNGDGLISGSSQVDVTQTTNYSSINQYSNTKVLDYVNDLGLVSSSGQLYTDTDDITEGSTNLYYTDARVKSKLTAENVISSSAQLTAEFDIRYGNELSDGLVSGSSQIDHDSTSGFVANEHIDHSTVSITAGNGLTGGGTIASTRTINVGQGDGISVTADSIAVDSSVLRTTGDGVVSGSAQISLTGLSDYDANDHIDHTSVSITAGAGLTGGGTIASTRTINVGAGDGISVAADSISVDATVLRTSGNSIVSASAQIDHDSTTNFVANEHIDHSSVSITAGNGLTGGGTIASTRTLNVGAGDGISVTADAVAVDATVLRTTGMGIVSGSSQVFSDISGDVLIASNGVATIQANSVALGTDTTGNYVATLGSGTGVTIGSNTGEGSTPTIAVNYGSTSNTAVQGNTSLSFAGTSGEISIDGGSSITLGSGGTVTIGLADTITGNRTFSNNVTVSGDLTVSGTTNFVNSQTLNIGDNNIVLNADVTGTPSANGGMTIERGTSTNASLLWNEANDYWTAGLAGAEERIVVGAGNTSITTLGTITTGTWNGTAIANGYLANSTISGVSLGSNLNTLTIGDGLSGTSYNGSSAVTIANTDKGSSQNIFKNFAVSGQSSVVADSNNDTLTLVAGSNVTITTNATTDSITIASSYTNTTYSAGTGLSLTGTEFANTGVLSVNGVTGAVTATNLLDAIKTVDGAGSGLDADTLDGLSSAVFLRSNATDTASGVITFSNSTASTSITTGAVIVTGGVGIGGALNVGGDVVAYASSDERLKDNIELISNPIEKVQALKGVTWNWNENADELQQSLPNVGVIAQDVEKVLPQLVHDRDNGFKGVDYAKLTGLLIEAIKEQQKQIDELKSKLS